MPPGQFDILRALVTKPAAVVFDVGANRGQSIELFRLLFEGCTIHAFEPQRSNFEEMLSRVGALDGVFVNQMALGDQVGTAALYRTSHSEASSLLPLNPDSWWGKDLKMEPRGTEAVVVDTIDHYCIDRDIATIDFLKLDVQGFEPECLRGAARMLSERRVGVIQAELTYHRIYERATRFADIEGLLNPFGYRLYTMYNISVGDKNGELLSLDSVFVRD